MLVTLSKLAIECATESFAEDPTTTRLHHIVICFRISSANMQAACINKRTLLRHTTSVFVPSYYSTDPA
jgi:hypothetical protein